MHAHVRTRCFGTLTGVLLWARLGEALHLVSGPAQGKDAEHLGRFADSCWS